MRTVPSIQLNLPNKSAGYLNTPYILYLLDIFSLSVSSSHWLSFIFSYGYSNKNTSLLRVTAIPTPHSTNYAKRNKKKRYVWRDSCLCVLSNSIQHDSVFTINTSTHKHTQQCNVVIHFRINKVINKLAIYAWKWTFI